MKWRSSLSMPEISEWAWNQMQDAAKATLNSAIELDERTRFNLQAISNGIVPDGISIIKNKNQED